MATVPFVDWCDPDALDTADLVVGIDRSPFPWTAAFVEALPEGLDSHRLPDQPVVVEVEPAGPFRVATRRTGRGVGQGREGQEDRE